MTVLPNAPIDSATGLPVPTIAVATDGGVSVIKDDGTVADITSSSTYDRSIAVDFLADNRLSLEQHSNTSGNIAWLITIDIPSSDRVITTNTKVSGEGYYDTRYPLSFNQDFWINQNASSSGDAIQEVVGLSSSELVAHTGILGITKIAEEDSKVNPLGAYITSDYNTGWMNGDIKLATLSDTDDTDVTGSELVTNGTFDTNTTGWLNTGGSTSWTSGQMQVVTPGSPWGGTYQSFSTVVGKRYIATFDVISNTSTAGVSISHVGPASAHKKKYTGVSGGNSYKLEWTATGTTAWITIDALNTSTISTITVDNFSVRLAEEDRSVNGNGLQVFGTADKDPVATGADLVAYSNASTSDYLFQPYNSDLDFAGDFSFTFWAKSNTTDQHTFFARQNPTTGSNSYGSTPYLFTQSNSSNTLSWYYRGTSSSGTYVSSAAIRDNNWHHFCLMRSGATMYAYIDGKLDGSFSFSESFVNTSAPFYVGIHSHNNSFLRPLSDGGVSLFRTSATAPTAEQIAKIYEDEKPLFQENAKATLNGSSDAVTALAYDDSTELLHVGTSGGRSTFQGLRRVDETSTSTTEISAQGGLIVEETA